MARCRHAEYVATCHRCRLARRRPEYRARWDGTTPPVPLPAIPDCIHLGPALPLQPGCGCAEKRRECSEFGEASLKPSKAEHHCLHADGSVACPAYEPRD